MEPDYIGAPCDVMEPVLIQVIGAVFVRLALTSATVLPAAEQTFAPTSEPALKSVRRTFRSVSKQEFTLSD